MEPRRRPTPGEWLTLFAFGAIAFATLRPAPGAVSTRSPWCLVCGDSGTLDVLLNIILFVPLGVGLALARVRAAKALALIVGTTVMVELVQYRLLAGREGTLSDVVFNTSGGLIGLTLGPRLVHVLRPGPALARRLGAGWALACVLLWLTMGFAFQRSVPAGAYALEWVPAAKPLLDVFTGRVLALGVNGQPVARGAPRPSDAMRLSLTDSVRIEALIEPGRPTQRTAAIAIVSRDTDEVALLGQRARSAVFGVRVRATDWRLKTPQIRLDDALPGAAAGAPAAATQRFHLVGTRTNRRYALVATRGDHSRSWAVDISPTLGWVLVLPFDYALHSGYGVGSVLWVAGLLAPLGYWGVWAARDRRAHGMVRVWIVPIVATLVLLGLVPAIFRLSASHPVEWVAAFAGMAAGAGLAAAVAAIGGGARPGRPGSPGVTGATAPRTHASGGPIPGHITLRRVE